MSTQTLNMSDRLYEYLLSVSVAADPLWSRLRDETRSTVGFNMQISPEQAQLMRVLLKLLNANKALEVGTFTGYSALVIAQALAPSGQLIACDVNREWTSIAERYWAEAGISDKIDLRIAPAIDTLNNLLNDGNAGTFDFAFIDADKENYVAYFELCLQLVRTGGIVAVDNTLWGGSVADPEKTDADTVAIRQLNQRIFTEPGVEASLIPIGDGLHIALKL